MTKLISVYINGTDESANFYGAHVPIYTNKDGSRVTSLANLLHYMTIQDGKNQAICLDGCGINNQYLRDFGFIFTWNLESQINILAEKIKFETQTEQIILNVYGFSRGGAGAFLLAKKLSDVPAERLEINILAFEPVPGNFVNNVYIDKALGFDLTLSSEISDLRSCKNIKRAHSIYNNIETSYCFARILPALPIKCEKSVDVVPGNHFYAQLFRIYQRTNGKYVIIPQNSETVIEFHQVSRFLEKCGTRFDHEKLALHEHLTTKAPLKEIYRDYVCKIKKTKEIQRAMQFDNYM